MPTPVRMESRDYDRYWQERDLERARARSQARARLALRLLSDARGEKRGRRLLEVGCGPGWALEVFRESGYDVRGVDISPRAVEMGSRRGLEMETLNLELDEIPGGYDVVVALEVLEHLVNPLQVLEKLKAALVRGGHLVVSLPNEFHLGRRLSVLCGRPGFGGHDDPHLRFFDEVHARRLFAASGLRVLERLSDSIAPPRWRLLKNLSRALVRVLPGPLALAHLFLLEPEVSGNDQ